MTPAEVRERVDVAYRRALKACGDAGLSVEDSAKALLATAVGGCLGVGMCQVQLERIVEDSCREAEGVIAQMYAAAASEKDA